MAIGDLERLVSDAKKNKQLVSHFALLGHDSGAFVTVANRLGYKITDGDVNTYLAQKTAAITKKKPAAQGAAASTAVTSTVAAVTTVAVQTTAGVTTIVGGGEVAVLVAGVVVLT